MLVQPLELDLRELLRRSQMTHRQICSGDRLRILVVVYLIQPRHGEFQTQSASHSSTRQDQPATLHWLPKPEDDFQLHTKITFSRQAVEKSPETSCGCI